AMMPAIMIHGCCASSAASALMSSRLALYTSWTLQATNAANVKRMGPATAQPPRTRRRSSLDTSTSSHGPRRHNSYGACRPRQAGATYDQPVVPEAPLERTEYGLHAAGDGWFVLNAREARWRDRPERGKSLIFAGATDFPQYVVNLYVLEPGEPIGMYHWEADQEDFFVVAGEPLLLVEGEERPLRQWDFVHCPPGTNHIIIGAGDTPCVVVAIGAT